MIPYNPEFDCSLQVLLKLALSSVIGPLQASTSFPKNYIAGAQAFAS